MVRSSSPDTITDTPPVPAPSYWLPDTPSPLSLTSPSSPINPFLRPPPPEPLFRMAQPLIPASPLSIFDFAVSPGFVVSPMSTTFGMGLLSPVTPTFLFNPRPIPTRETTSAKLLSTTTTDRADMSLVSPLSPRFMFPRTAPWPRKVQVKSEQAVEEDLMDRKASIARMLTMGQERMHIKIRFYQWLAVRPWEGMEKDQESSWVSLIGKLQGLWNSIGGRDRITESEQMVKQSRIQALKNSVKRV
ncbi:hypothetical protein ACEQ8H_004902 [Pleosporales sp. CAS-2024a]